MSKRVAPKFVLIMVLVCAILMTLGMVYAEPAAATPESEVKIMHVSDTHYIPSYYCYQGDLKENDFATKIKGDPKLMLESYAVLVETIRMIKEEAPDYVFITGDITSNGEMQALIDIANALRQVQDEVRSTTNPNFQILVVPGNHDVFNNRHASNYNHEDGKKTEARSASRKEFIKIFASLGYPDLTDAEAEAFYSGDGRDAWLVNGHHLPYKPNGDIAYIPCKVPRRDPLRYEYFMPDLDAAEVNGLGGLTYIVYDDAKKMSIAGFDSTLSIEGDQRTEGEYTKENLDWYLAKDLSDYTQYSMGHHNLINHHPKQEEYTQAFVTYGWEETAEWLTRNGLKYSFTGHFHANDVASYVSFNNNVMYDIETGATISEGSAVRKVVVKDYGKGKTNMTSTLVPVKEMNVKYLMDHNIMPEGYDDCFIDKEKGIVDVQKYIEAKLFNPYLSNMVDSFISTTKIGASIDKLAPIEIKLFNKKFTIDTKEIVNVLIDEVGDKALKDYTYHGTMPSLAEPDNKVIGYLHELLSNAIKSEVAAGKSFEELVIYCYGQHLNGAEVQTESELPEWVQSAFRDFRSGKHMDMVLDAVLYSDNGIYNLVDKIAKTPLDLTRCKNSIDTIRSVVQLLKLDVNLDRVVLNDLVPEVLKNSVVKTLLTNAGITLNLEGDSLMVVVDRLLDTYLDESTKTGMGSILVEIASSFATDDDVYDGKFNETIDIKRSKEDAYTTTGDGLARVIPTVENGRLPSEITATFGKDPKSMMNFVWFTSQFVPNGTLRYKVEGATEWVEVTAVSEIVPYSFPLFDLGIFSNKIDKFTARHNVRLEGLTAGKSYEYMVGDKDRDVWSESRFFKTAPAEAGAFEIAILSDMQNYESIAYGKSADALAKSSALFEGSRPDFAVSLGDIISDGNNDHQWQDALNIPAFWGNTTIVPVAGGNERKLYESGKTKIRKKSCLVNPEPIEYLPMHFHFDMGGELTDTTNYYSFDYSGVHFVVLDSRDGVRSTGEMNTSEINWLKTDLAKATTMPKVVFMHKGIYSPGIYGAGNDVVALRAQLAPIFYENKVDLVFQGHAHVYAETARLDGNGKEAEDGVKYITVGTMGSKFYDYVDNENVNVAFGKELYEKEFGAPTMGKLAFDGEQLTYQGYALKGEKFVKVEDYTKNNMVWLYVILAVIVVAAVTFGIVYKLKHKDNKAPHQDDESQSAEPVVVEDETAEVVSDAGDVSETPSTDEVVEETPSDEETADDTPSIDDAPETQDDITDNSKTE